MYHPSIYVLVTDLDDMEEMEAAASQKCPLGTSSSAEAAALAALSSASNQSSGGNDTRKPLAENCSNNKPSTAAAPPPTITSSSTTKSSLAHMIERLKIDHTKVQPYYDTQTRNFTCNTTNTHAPPQAACEMPERAWQDCVTNSLHIQHTLNGTIFSSSTSSTISSLSSSSSSSSSSTNTNTTNTSGSPSTHTTGSGNENIVSTNPEGGGVDHTDNVTNSMNVKQNLTTPSSNLSQKQQQQQIWGFIDPTQKAPCICTK